MSTLTWHLNRLAGTLTGGGGGASRQNLCTNPAATNDTTGWASNTTFVRTTSITGMPVTTGINFTGNGFMQTPPGVCAPGDVITMSFYIKNNTGIDIPARTCYVGFTRSAGGDTFPETYTVTPGTSLVRASFTAAAAPALATGVYTLIDSINGTAPGGIDISAVLLEKSASLGTYFDGTVGGGTWDGAAGNSSSTISGGGGSTGACKETAVSAANIWAGTVGLSLVDALNEKAGHPIPTRDVAGCLNELAGTVGLTPLDAISRIP